MKTLFLFTRCLFLAAQMLGAATVFADPVLLAGDTFGIVIEDCGTTDKISETADSLLRQAAEPMDVLGHRLVVTLSIGIALYPSEIQDVNALIRGAETAMFYLLETILAPVWVWMIFTEQPTDAALLGGAIILAALVAHTVWEMRRERDTPV